MQIILDNEETWSLMAVIASRIIDQAGLSPDGRVKVKRWRSDRTTGTGELADLTVEFNEALGSTLDEKTTKLIRQRGYYVSSREQP
ncbi:MAG: hypothetical protein ACR2PL_09850 [Dehalococcoidia bacterium]